jgi:2-succinyl-5-enolpyruvyl-6-hydroxy-3-cyclohexene-1-carboxylate synthase
VFNPNVNGFYEFPPDFENAAHLDKVMHDAAEVIRRGCIEKQGPVHLNLVLNEPLYKKIPKQVMTRPHIPGIRSGDPYSYAAEDHSSHAAGFNTSEIALLREHLVAQKKVLILAGMAKYSKVNRTALETLTSRYQVAVIAENITNLHGKYMISAPELVLAGASKEEMHALTPDLVVAMGGPIVSKRTRLFIQDQKDAPVILLNGTPERALPGINELILESLEAADLARSGTNDEFPPNDDQKNDPPQENRYGTTWKNLEARSELKVGSFLTSTSFSNITAVGKILEKTPSKTTVHLGNSSVIRYAQLLPARADLRYQGNRGTSGIDGSLSTAVGAAMVSEELHVAIVGDLSFVYDSNALWNRNFPPNLKIIVLNDNGGGIFRLLDGPDRMPFFEEFSVTRHPVTIKHIVNAFGMNILMANNDYTLDECLDTLFEKGAEATVMEVDTSSSENSGIFKQFFNAIQP